MKEIINKQIEIEKQENDKLDLSLFKRKSSAKSYKGWLIGEMKKAISDNNRDVGAILQTCYKKYLEFDEIKNSAYVRLAKWKGKSGIHIINEPEKFIVIRYRKFDKFSEPKEMRRTIMKKDVNLFIHALNLAKKDAVDGKINTKYICQEYCLLTNLTENNHNKPLFDINGFIWDSWFSDRFLHCFGNDILGILDFYGVILYNGGTSEILKRVVDIQECL